MGGILKPDPPFLTARAGVHASVSSSAVGHVSSKRTGPEGFRMTLSVLTLARTLPSQITGGLEESSWNLARSLSNMGVEGTILTTSFSGQRDVRKQDGVTIHELAYVPGSMRIKPTCRWGLYL